MSSGSFVVNREEEDGSNLLFLPCVDTVAVACLDGLWIGRRIQTASGCCVDGVTNPYVVEGSSSAAAIVIEMECIMQFM